VFDWPAGGELVVPNVECEVTGAYLLAGKKKLKVSRDGGNVVVAVPEEASCPINTVVVLKTK
jgi:hypothetical protein